jgi:hypothetical protein
MWQETNFSRFLKEKRRQREILSVRWRNLPRLRFTLMHEAAHWLIHRPVFAADNPFGAPGVYENQYLAVQCLRVRQAATLCCRLPDYFFYHENPRPRPYA